MSGKTQQSGKRRVFNLLRAEGVISRAALSQRCGLTRPAVSAIVDELVRDGLVFEANHDMQMLMQGPYPVYLKRRIASSMGHLSNDEAGEALCSLMGPHTTNVLLAHLSRTNNLPQLAYGTVCRRLAEAGICTDPVSVAPRMAVHSLICLDKR